ncbi:protein of unassigned function [Methylobacterium oryzae CBMB20]|uniref:Protein of unassigned function n=1 Tax=Methylobacterium oryzae CBMB20 TaxID=693986 RepID=A0A089NUX3_9HYPH|nr:protein of unassigned function [Methylobacterium oryzae CBMB20]
MRRKAAQIRVPGAELFRDAAPICAVRPDGLNRRGGRLVAEV